MSEYVKWEPVVGQVPPDGCEFIVNCNAHMDHWSVWDDSGNRAINKIDPTLFQFRIPAPTKENPVVIKYFTFEERPEAVKEYKTLADVPEGVRCAVTFKNSRTQLVLSRDGSQAVGTEGYTHPHLSSEYTVVQILDPLPAPQLPATMADAEECRVYLASNGRHYFKDDVWMLTLSQVYLGGPPFYSPHCLTNEVDAMDRVRITAATNTYAVSCSQEVK